MTAAGDSLELYALRLPVLAAGMVEGEVVEVHVAVGETVRRDQAVLSVETDKVQLLVESPVAGRIHEILVKPGGVVAVGQALMLLDESATQTNTTPSGSL